MMAAIVRSGGKAIAGMGLMVMFLSGQNKEAAPIGKGPQIQFEQTEHNFGVLNQGDPAEYEFVFKNTGDEPLIITSARGSCGCTVPSYSNEPIPPGGKGKIKVKYDSHRIGPFHKTVTVTSNATNQPTVILKIHGEVKPVKQEDLSPKQEKPMVPAKGT